jgi:TonB family protein
LVVRVEITVSGTDGRIVRMGVVRSSGVASFDVAALDAFEQAAPFGPPPLDILSTDGNVYVHWELHRDPVFACSTINARPYLISVD